MLMRLLNRYASRVKGADYRIDDRLGTGFLVAVVTERVMMKLRGMVLFPCRAQKPFVGRGVRIRGRRRITFGRGVTFGHNCYVDAFSAQGVTFGSHVSVGKNTRIECTGNLRTIGTGLRVADNVGLGTDSFYGCGGGVRIGEETIIGNAVSFHSEEHNFSDPTTPIRLQGVSRTGISVGANCWIGAKCTILDGAVIADGCIFAAGSVVPAGRYLADGIYGGVPAKLIKSRLTGPAPSPDPRDEPAEPRAVSPDGG